MQQPWVPEELCATDEGDRHWNAEDDGCDFMLKPYTPGQLPPGTPSSGVMDEHCDSNFFPALCAADSRIDYNRQIGILVGGEDLCKYTSEMNQGFQILNIVQ